MFSRAAAASRGTMIRQCIVMELPVGLTVVGGIAFGLIAYADATGLDQALRSGAIVWTCKNPW